MNKENLNESGFLYGKWKTDFDSWAIQTRNVTMFLIVGSEKALLIDTAFGEGNLPEIIRSITDLPLIVCDTHPHYDHAGGNGFFEEVWIGKDGKDTAYTAQSRFNLPYPEYKVNTIEDGMIFDLGDRQIEAIAIGAHHKSSIAFLDKKTRTLYTGDELEGSQVLLFVHGEAEDGKEVTGKEIASRHLKNMKKLKSRISEFDRVVPAHNSGALSTSYIDEYIELGQLVVDDKIAPEPTCSGWGWPNNIMGGDEELIRVTHKNVSFVLKK